jgi:hypothetical protein
MQEWEKCGAHAEKSIRERQFRCVVQWHLGGDPYNAAHYRTVEGYGETEAEAAEACLASLFASPAVQ